MFQELIGKALKEHGGDVLSNFNLSGEKKDQAIDLAKETIGSKIMDEASSGNFGAIKNAFSQGSSSGLVQNIITSYGSKLVAKLGMSPDVATTISSKLVPMVFDFINKDDSAPTNSESGIKDLIGGAVQGAIGDKIGGMLKGKFGF